MTARITRPRIKPGPAPKVAPADAAQRIEAMAADGFSIVGVARGLGTSKDTLHRWMDDDPSLQEAFDSGREKERHALHNMLFRQAVEKNNVVAAFFLLKCRHSYVENAAVESGNRVQITFTLPGAVPLADFQTKTIEHGQPDNRDERVSAPSLALTRGS
ncbi:MAG: hypothetical protein ABI881_15370 [Betaproteobacteria bacterium]